MENLIDCAELNIDDKPIGKCIIAVKVPCTSLHEPLF